MSHEANTDRIPTVVDVQSALDNLLQFAEPTPAGHVVAEFVDPEAIPGYQQEGRTPLDYPYLSVTKIDDETYKVSEDDPLNGLRETTYTMFDGCIWGHRYGYELLNDGSGNTVDFEKEDGLSLDEISDLYLQLTTGSAILRQDLINKQQGMGQVSAGLRRAAGKLLKKIV